MVLSESDYVIQALPADGTNYAFRISIFPGCPRNGYHFPDPEHLCLP